MKQPRPEVKTRFKVDKVFHKLVMSLIRYVDPRTGKPMSDADIARSHKVSPSTISRIRKYPVWAKYEASNLVLIKLKVLPSREQGLVVSENEDTSDAQPVFSKFDLAAFKVETDKLNQKIDTLTQVILDYIKADQAKKALDKTQDQVDNEPDSQITLLSE